MDAFRGHGKLRLSLEENVVDAEQVMAALGRCDISMDAVTEKLVEDGVQLFADAFDELLGAVSRKRAVLLGDKLDSQSMKLPTAIENAVEDFRSKSWRRHGNVRRLWAADASLWSGIEAAKWLGWLVIATKQDARVASLSRLADKVANQGFSHAALLGMGGSSLGPEVFSETFGHHKGHPELLVLNFDRSRRNPDIGKQEEIDPARTIFVVSSKSGSTLEPNILERYFFECVSRAVGADAAGSRFIAITDPGSRLQTVAERNQFRHIAFGIPTIGGRYSVLSNFGLVPAAVLGLDVGRLLGATQKMVRSCDAFVPPADNPGVVLGIALGEAARSGRDKVTIVASPGIADFGAWLEQLLAKSTGKEGKGIIPIDGEPLGSARCLWKGSPVRLCAPPGRSRCGAG